MWEILWEIINTLGAAAGIGVLWLNMRRIIRAHREIEGWGFDINDTLKKHNSRLNAGENHSARIVRDGSTTDRLLEALSARVEGCETVIRKLAEHASSADTRLEALSETVHMPREKPERSRVSVPSNPFITPDTPA